MLSGKWNEGLKNGISGGNIELASKPALFSQSEGSKSCLGLLGGRGEVPQTLEKFGFGLALLAGVFAPENICEVPFLPDTNN